MQAKKNNESNFPIIMLFIFCMFLISCSRISENDSEVFKMLEESLINSNKMISRSTETIYVSLEDKLSDPYTANRARKWYPKATQVQKTSKDIIGYIENLKGNANSQLTLNSDQADELFIQLKKYKTDLLSIDSGLTEALGKTLIITTQSFDSLPDSEKNFSKKFFDQISQEETLCLLSKFENNIRMIENTMTQYCYNKVGAFIHYYDTYSAIIGQNTSYVQGGEMIEITAGIGAFSKAAMPKVILKDRIIPIDEMGVATFKFRASKKPGKHFVPVEISYTDQEGIKRKLSKTVEYTVAGETIKD